MLAVTQSLREAPLGFHQLWVTGGNLSASLWHKHEEGNVRSDKTVSVYKEQLVIFSASICHQGKLSDSTIPMATHQHVQKRGRTVVPDG